MGAEAAERDADRALELARREVREAREEVKRLEIEAKEEARRAKIKAYHAKEVSKRGKALGRKCSTYFPPPPHLLSLLDEVTNILLLCRSRPIRFCLVYDDGNRLLGNTSAAVPTYPSKQLPKAT